MTHRAPLSNRHAEESVCPANKRTKSGKSLHPACLGRSYSQAICTCDAWQFKYPSKGPGKGCVNESRKRHRATHSMTDPKGPTILHGLLRLDFR
ncbi:hypothetical protein J5Y04_13620 [Kitasatospora sp. RG8]|uniref:hypothetical protein n=1 Tax=Kitasatospora sp. RG8 TaxID=2820815 RepID=UPI001ADF8C05|nr:hypothetical protein [Kitasatospora sp. RG8]MBP0450576.1 hypothetical protein [Kitasatospora sp. RG8]